MKERKSKVLYALVVMCALFALAKPVDVKAANATIPYNGQSTVRLSEITENPLQYIDVKVIWDI